MAAKGWTKSELHKLAGEIKPSEFLDYSEYLAKLFKHLKLHQDGYSYQKFSQDLGFSATIVSHHIIKGRRPLTEVAAGKIIKSLKITGVQRRYFVQMVRYKNSTYPSDCVEC